jgi:hypothetical protein
MANVIAFLPSAGPFTVLPSAARTTAPDTQEFEIPAEACAMHLVVDVTAKGAAPSITVTVSGVDRASGKVYTLLASAAISTVSTTVLKIGPSLTASANAVANDYVPGIIRFSVAHGNSDSITYTIAGHLISA